MAPTAKKHRPKTLKFTGNIDLAAKRVLRSY